jgi:hypothetical protein
MKWDDGPAQPPFLFFCPPFFCQTLVALETRQQASEAVLFFSGTFPPRQGRAEFSRGRQPAEYDANSVRKPRSGDRGISSFSAAAPRLVRGWPSRSAGWRPRLNSLRRSAAIGTYQKAGQSL